MKKISSILTLFVFCLPIAGFSQKARVGFSLGLSVAKITGDVNGTKTTGKSNAGYTAGLIVDAPINTHFSFQPGIYYVQKGDVLSKTDKVKVSRELHYIEFPLNVVYNSNGSNGNFYVGVGPSLSLGVPSATVTNTKGGSKTSSDLVFGNTGIEDFKGFDYGINGLAGYRMKRGMFIAVNLTQGLRNLIPDGKADGKLHNCFIGIQIGMLIDNK